MHPRTGIAGAEDYERWSMMGKPRADDIGCFLIVVVLALAGFKIIPGGLALVIVVAALWFLM